MIDPSEFGKMINWAFVCLLSQRSQCFLMSLQIVATFIYTLIACAGYLMFGNSVSAEVRSFPFLSSPANEYITDQH